MVMAAMDDGASVYRQEHPALAEQELEDLISWELEAREREP